MTRERDALEEHPGDDVRDRARFGRTMRKLEPDAPESAYALLHCEPDRVPERAARPERAVSPERRMAGRSSPTLGRPANVGRAVTVVRRCRYLSMIGRTGGWAST